MGRIDRDQEKGGLGKTSCHGQGCGGGTRGFADPTLAAKKQKLQVPIVPKRWSFHRSEEHTSELQSRLHLVCRLLLETKQDEPAPAHDHTRSHTLPEGPT